MIHMRLAVFGFAILSSFAVGAAHGENNSRDEGAASCSRWLAGHGPEQMSDRRHRCVIAVASTYIDAEENSLPPEKQLFADDVSRHRIGNTPKFMPGNRAKLFAEDSHKVISAIKNRQWTVDGDTAWILYEGYLKAKPDQIGFYVAERITLERGLIKEILVADVTVAK
jgi:hypothetical protein